MHCALKLLPALLFAIALCAACRSDQPPQEPGWIDLFDGSTLAGWVTRGGHYDGDARWTVESGALTGRQGPHREGGLIYTEAQYSNFEFECDVKIDYPFDSGIFLRMVPEERGAQVTIDYRPGGEIGAIYSDGYLEHNEQAIARFKKDSWNRFRVLCTGRDMAIEVWLNGTRVTRYRMADGSPGFAPQGRIGLQVHGGETVPLETKVQFKNIRLRPLALEEGSAWTSNEQGLLTPTHSGLLEGWRPLLGGADLESWQIVGPREGISLQDGVLTLASGDGYLATKAVYGDFRLRLDFKIGPCANSGVFLRARPGGEDPACSGCEIQLIDDHNWEAATGTTLKPWQFTGSLYGSVASNHPELVLAAPAWNTLQVTFVGTRLRVRLNGVELYDVDVLQVPGDPPFRDRARAGFIGLQRHTGAKPGESTYVSFRNVFVQRLEPEAP